ncbi:VWA domain-containing protein [Haloferula chungangensis]|uniref:VWA domain-containing protein n=2 Tax=Haloferula chungangensis TaxID=1048331 RepID=A0ABW2L408_9BACT
MNEETLQFAQPIWIAVGVVLVVLGVLLFLRADRRRRADLVKLAHPRFHSRLVAGWSSGLRWTRRVLWLVAVMALALAAARPQFGYEWREVKRRGIDILFAVDTSRSMLAEDLTPNRLERARMGVIDFIEQLEGDRVGLIPFAGTAFALCPLTLDYDAFRESLNSINTDLIPRPGTDLASAIKEADRLFDEEGNNQRLLVLITDGEDLEGAALKAAEESAELGTTIYTVGVGAADGQLIPVRDRYGRQTYLTDENGEEVRTKLDSATLEKIAEATGGLYVPLGRGAEGLDSIYQQRLALVPKSELAQKLEQIPLERFQWPLGFAILMLLIQTVMSERKREGKRKELVSAARRVHPVAAVMFAWGISMMEGRSNVVADYNEGTTAYENGEYEAATEKLKASLSTSDLEVQGKAYYNLGNSLYRVGQGLMQEDPKKTIESWEKSVKAFEDALALNEADEDAEFNRDFVKKKLEELKEQQPQEQENQNEQQNQDEQEKSEDSQDGEPQENQDGEPQEGQDGDEQKQEEQSGENGEQQEGEDGQQGEQDQQDQQDQQGGEEEQEQENEGAKGQEDQSNGEPEQPAEGDPGEARQDEQEAREGEPMSEARKEGEMSREEAIRLLESLANDERIVVPAPLSEQNAERRKARNAKEKTW